MFAFEGDGDIKASDFYASERIARIKAPDNNALWVDVTEAVNAARSVDQRFISFHGNL